MNLGHTPYIPGANSSNDLPNAQDIENVAKQSFRNLVMDMTGAEID